MESPLFAPFCTSLSFGGESVQFSKSLKQNSQFRRLYHRGKSVADRNLVLYCRPNGTEENRIGLTVSAKLGCAVQRNRLRRRLRECYRLHESEFRAGYHMVVVARGRAMNAEYRELERSLLQLAAKQKLLREDEGDA